MHKVKRMTQAPHQCLTCGRGNVPDDPHTEDDLWFLDLERDVNWGDPTYLCMYCCESIGVMAGLVSMQDLKDAQDVNRAQSRKIHDLQAKLEGKQRRIDLITGGARAVKKEKEERSKKRTQTVQELRDKTKKKRKVTT